MPMRALCVNRNDANVARPSPPEYSPSRSVSVEAYGVRPDAMAGSTKA